ncbi:hypothetical protein [Mucisphaera calidilacus]|uniref:Uncharacterized protein n=1 Tax=Mucisphaera calidilacus TaxID=2527982 RepID=A0A518BWF6_9BACT|nr:hypothetical protein [Mucisphaera calidilacus]QDU71291.1 hypothetical protein Pan265_11400 [Mucisphaera calidilacus]
MDQQTAETLGALSDTAISLYLTGGLVIVGIILLFAGSKLARASCVLLGLALGSTLAAAAGQFLALSPMLMIAASLVGALVGALFAGFLFRAFVACAGAVILAAAVPAAGLAWQGAPPPELETDTEVVEQLQTTPGDAAEALTAEQITTAAQDIIDRLNDAFEQATASEPEDDAVAVEDTTEEPASLGIADTLRAAATALREALADQEEAIMAWWQQLSPTSRGIVVVGSLIGAVVGFLVGLLAPKTAAAFDSALLGSVLIYLPGSHVLATVAPATGEMLPTGARAAILIMGLITIMGILIQWTIFRRKTDS